MTPPVTASPSASTRTVGENSRGHLVDVGPARRGLRHAHDSPNMVRRQPPPAVPARAARRAWSREAKRLWRARRGPTTPTRSTGAAQEQAWAPHSYLLTTRGRRTGQPRTTPVTVVERDGRRYLVAPYGPVSWVLNARAAGHVTLRRRGRRADYQVREVDADEAGPVLKQYIGIARPTRPYFRAAPDAPVTQFVAEAKNHPVFELTRQG
ncbi:nitroreductase family deazaflavin-dependent oxidoreductase [Actinoplanes sp. NPDC020271]|uniref:nitroreductase family deazaflavin-dependent oxidoreductase n=1 Tax=Actinoplanes sp. NPDC020271 TaxID=3363896 RepID=UPI003798DF5D